MAAAAARECLLVGLVREAVDISRAAKEPPAGFRLRAFQREEGGVIGESDDDDEEDDEVEGDESDSDGNGGIDEAGGHGKDRVSAAARAATSDAAAAKRRRKKRHDPYVDPSTAVVESLLRRIGALNKRWARGGGP